MSLCDLSLLSTSDPRWRETEGLKSVCVCPRPRTTKADSHTGFILNVRSQHSRAQHLNGCGEVINIYWRCFTLAKITFFSFLTNCCVLSCCLLIKVPQLYCHPLPDRWCVFSKSVCKKAGKWFVWTLNIWQYSKKSRPHYDKKKKLRQYNLHVQKGGGKITSAAVSVEHQ